jgi:hypothetical protein
LPPIFFEASFSFRRLRTTQARKPRTECGCQPVAFIIAAIVAPVGDWSMAMTRDCVEPTPAFFVCCDRFAAATADGAVAGDCFLADFDIKILRSVHCGVPPHHRSPTSALAPAGQDLASAPLAPGMTTTTAPIGSDRQSFLKPAASQSSDI